MLTNAVVDTLVVATEDDDVLHQRETVGLVLVVGDAIGRGEDNLVVVALRLKLLDAAVDRLNLHHHARLATKGVVIDGATLIGAGEAGREAIVPLENRRAMQPFAAAVSEDMQDGGTLADVLAVLIQIRDKSADVYIDRDKIGRAMAPNINARIGNNAVMVSRGGSAYAF